MKVRMIPDESSHWAKCTMKHVATQSRKSDEFGFRGARSFRERFQGQRVTSIVGRVISEHWLEPTIKKKPHA